MAANGFGQAATTLLQLVQIPLMLALMGKAGAADWVVLNTVPAQLAGTDLGFGAAAISEMTQRVARNDEAGARRVFQSCWLLVSIINVVAVVTAALVILFSDWPHWARITTLTDFDARATGLVLVTLVLFQQQLSLVAAAYKSSGHYARVTTRENWIRLAQAAAGFICLLVHPSLLSFFAGYTVAFVAGVAWLSAGLKAHAPWAGWGFKDASFAEVKPLFKPALSFAAFSLALTVNLQAFVGVINLVLGKEAVLIWSTLRTVSRALIQINQIIVSPSQVELARCIGEGDYQSARKIHRSFLWVTAGVGLGLAALILLVCPWAYPVYVKHEVPYHPAILSLLLTASLLTALWNVPMTVAMSVNRHTTLTVLYFVASLAGLGVAWSVMPHFGLIGAGVAAAAIELVMLPFCFMGSLKLLGQTPKEFLYRDRVSQPLA